MTRNDKRSDHPFGELDVPGPPGALRERVAPPTLSARVESNRLVVRLHAVLDTASANRPESWRLERSDGTVVSQGMTSGTAQQTARVRAAPSP